MARLGKRSGFADSDEEEEDGYGGGELMNPEEEEEILSSYGISRRSRSTTSRAASAVASDSVHLPEPEVDPTKLKYGNNRLIPIINHKMDEHVGKMLHVVESLSLRLSEMDSKSSQLETSVDQLNGSLKWQHERTHEKLRQLEGILKEVQGAVKDLKDKYEIAETQIELTRLQISKTHLPHQRTGTMLTKVVKPTSTIISHQPNQQVVTVDVTHPSHHGVDHNHSPWPSYNSPLPPASTQTHIQQPSYSNLIPPQTTPYCQPLPHLEQKHGEYIMPLSQEIQPTFPGPIVPYDLAPNLAHSTQKSFHLHPVVSQQHTSFGKFAGELEAQPQNYYCEPLSRFSGPSQRAYGSDVGRPNSDPCNEPFSEKGHCADNQPYQYVPTTKDDSGHYPSTERSRSNFMQFPVTEVSELSLPHALPMASFIDEEPNASSHGNQVLADEANVIDKVTAMGFRRDIVKVIVKKLKENGKPIDLNGVLDKLMNSE
uniref:DUF1421 domain-containing protein n=1 Tax=Kalanchoe fedtschenkoi TaxID=63787 RepID=A0A7N0TJ09_KALFE